MKGLNNYRNILTTRKIYATSHFAPCAASFKKEREARRRRRDITIYSVKLDRVTYSTITSQYHLPFTKKKNKRCLCALHKYGLTLRTLPILLFISPFTPKKKNSLQYINMDSHCAHFPH